MTEIVIAVVMVLSSIVVVALAARKRRDEPPGEHDDPWNELRAEMERARRYERAFTLVRVRLTATRGVGVPPVLDGTTLVRRRTDRAWRTEDEHYLLLVETDGDGARCHIAHLQARHPELRMTCRAASFPADGLTISALLAVIGADEDTRPRTSGITRRATRNAS